MLNLSKCQNVSHVGLSSLTNGADNLEQLVLSYGPSVSLKPCDHPSNFFFLHLANSSLTFITVV